MGDPAGKGDERTFAVTSSDSIVVITLRADGSGSVFKATNDGSGEWRGSLVNLYAREVTEIARILRENCQQFKEA